MDQIKSPSGNTLTKIATRTTTPTSDSTPKQVHVQTDTIEIIVSDSRAISMGSQFGHSAIVIDGIE